MENTKEELHNYLTNYSIDELKLEYSKLVKEKKDYEIDLIYTQNKLDDYRTPSNEITELRSDLIYDENKIGEIDGKIKIIKDFCESKGIILEPKVLQKKNQQ